MFNAGPRGQTREQKIIHSPLLSALYDFLERLCTLPCLSLENQAITSEVVSINVEEKDNERATLFFFLNLYC